MLVCSPGAKEDNFLEVNRLPEPVNEIGKPLFLYGWDSTKFKICLIHFSASVASFWS